MIAWRDLASRVLVDLAFVASALALASLGGDLWWPLELLGHFRGCYSLALAPLAIGLLALRAKFAGFATLLIVAIDLAFVVPIYFGGGAATGPANLRLLIANVCVPNERHELFLQLIEVEQPDVIAVFEYGRGWADALAVLDAEYPHSLSMPRRDAFGMAFWSKLPCDRLDFLESDAAVPTIDAQVRGAFGTLAMVATHPPRPGLTGPPTSRDSELRAAATRAAETNSPVVLFGDFNATSHAPIFKEMLAIADLRDARQGFGPRPTWPGIFAPVGIAIDHVLVGEGVEVVDHRVGPPIGSDHRPVIVDLGIR